VSDVDRRGPVDVRLVRLIPGLRRHLMVVSAVAAATAVVVIVQAELLANGLADLVQNDDVSGGLMRMLVALGVVALVRAAGAGTTEWSAGRAMRSIRHDVRAAVLDHARADGDRTVGGLASREATVATTGVDELEPYVRQFLPALMLAVTVPVAAGARILVADPASALLIAVTVPLIPVFMVLIGRMTERRTQRQWAVLQRLGGHFLDVIEGLPTLRLFGRAKAQRDAVHDVSEQYRASTMTALRIAFLSAFALELIATLSVALIAVEIGLRLASGGLVLTTALIVLLLAPECYLPLRRVGASFHAAQSGLDAGDDLHDLLERPTLPTGTRAAPTSGPMMLRDVALVRHGRVVLDGVDLDVAPGSVVAVYGPSGIGKSTLVDACRGRLADRRGAITVGGVDVRDLDPDSWADQLAVIGQRLTPLGTTIAEEVRGSTSASDDMVAAALDDVDLAALRDRRTDELSGGQLRRVQVARALVAVRCGRARFVLADEPTAHLDAATADRVWRALAGLAGVHSAAMLIATHDARCRAFADEVIDFGGPLDDRPSPAPTQPRLRTTLTLSAPAKPAVADTDTDSNTDTGSTTRSDDVVPGPHELWSATRRIMRMARPARRRFTGATALGALGEACTLGLAGVAAWLIVKASEQPDLAELSLAILAVRTFGIAKGVFRYGERLATHDAGLRSLSEIRAAVVDRLADIAPAGIPGWERGDLRQRVVDDVDRLLDLFVRVLGPVLSVAATAAAAVLITLVLDTAAGAVLVVALVIVGVLLPSITAARETTIGPLVADQRARLAGATLSYTEALDALIAHRVERGARARIDVAGAGLDRLATRRTRVRMAGGAVVAAAPLATTIATLAVIGPSATSIAGPVLGVLVLWPLAIVELAGTVNDTAAAAPSVAGSALRVVAALDTPDPLPAPTHPRTVGDTPDLTIDDLTARWPTSAHDVLGPVAIEFPFGSHTTISGPSGSGKSTFAAVLVGFLAPHSGAYRIDGDDLATIGGANVRERVTWVQQLPWLADTTVRENLRIADPAADDYTLNDALRAVRLGAWLDDLPHGLDTRIGRGGSGMSGGEAQRLALARVLLADHRVVVLDEPTAHLDADTAEHVLDTTLDRFADRTTIVLGHGPAVQAAAQATG